MTTTTVTCPYCRGKGSNRDSNGQDRRCFACAGTGKVKAS